jgi:hypothetical protein
MQGINKIINDESGAMLIGVVLVLIAVTAIGVTVIKMSTFEMDISISEKCKEEARYNSESCTMSGAKLIKFIMTEASEEGFLGIPEGDSRVQGITYADPVSGGTKQQELAMKILAPDQTDNVCEDFTLTPAGTTMDAAANILPTGADANIGTAANRQISGYSYGIGLGGAGGGGFSNWFIVACRGGGCNQNGNHVSYTRYRRVPGIKGGF